MRVDYVKVSDIDPNPGNPRGIEIASQDTKLPLLIDSIRQFSVLVPIVVAPRDGRYFLVDGERRYTAAKALHLKEIPAFITDKGMSDKDILYRMFQIHHNREPWGPIQQCRALEVVYSAIVSKKDIQSVEDERVKVQAIAEQLVTKTGIELRTALDRIKFLRWPKSVKEPLYHHPTDDYWYICEIEDKIIIPAMRNYPEYFEKVEPDEVRVALYEKLKHHSVKTSTDVRRAAPIFAASRAEPSDRKKVTKILSELYKNRDMTYEEAAEDFIRQFPDAVAPAPPSPRRLLSLLQHLETAIANFDPSEIKTATRRAKAKPKEVMEAAQSLRDALEKLIAEIKEQMDG
jgi:ParB/RepB/Spo0J family partition protein